MLDHRVARCLSSGQEPEPFVAAVNTRARARARFIREHSDGERAYMNWDRAIMRSTGRPVFLTDPFAEAYAG